jgi:hypothetical protein
MPIWPLSTAVVSKHNAKLHLTICAAFAAQTEARQNLALTKTG